MQEVLRCFSHNQAAAWCLRHHRLLTIGAPTAYVSKRSCVDFVAAGRECCSFGASRGGARRGSRASAASRVTVLKRLGHNRQEGSEDAHEEETAAEQAQLADCLLRARGRLGNGCFWRCRTVRCSGFTGDCSARLEQARARRARERAALPLKAGAADSPHMCKASTWPWSRAPSTTQSTRSTAATSPTWTGRPRRQRVEGRRRRDCGSRHARRVSRADSHTAHEATFPGGFRTGIIGSTPPEQRDPAALAASRPDGDAARRSGSAGEAAAAR